MKLYKLQNKEQETRYFTDTAKAARYIETTQSYIDKCRKENKKCKGWIIEETNDGNILSRYINPERQ